MHRTLTALALAGTLALTPALAGAADTTDRSTDRVAVAESDRRPHDLAFDCGVRRTDRGPIVGCRWTPVGEDRATGYRLLRSVDDGAREVVFETRNNRIHAHRELVRPGHHYRYAVQYVAEDGAVLHTSRVVHLRIPGRDAA